MAFPNGLLSGHFQTSQVPVMLDSQQQRDLCATTRGLIVPFLANTLFCRGVLSFSFVRAVPTFTIFSRRDRGTLPYLLTELGSDLRAGTVGDKCPGAHCRDPIANLPIVQMPLRGNTPGGERPVVGVLEAQEVVVGAALVGVMALRQEKESTLRGPGVLFRPMVAQPLEALPVEPLFRLLLTLPAFGLSPSQQLDVLLDDAYACCRRFNAAANHLTGLASGFSEFLLRNRLRLLPVRECLGERVRAILLAAEIAERTPPRLSLIVAVALDQIITPRVAGSA
jgi:hypothetical protein